MEEETDGGWHEVHNSDDPVNPGFSLVTQTHPQHLKLPCTQDQDRPIMHWEDLSIRIAELEKQEEERRKKAEPLSLQNEEPVTGHWPQLKQHQSFNRSQWEDVGDFGGHRIPCITSWFNSPKKLQLCFINDNESDQEDDEGSTCKEGQRPHHSQGRGQNSNGLKQEVRAALSELRDKLWAEQRQQRQLIQKDVSFRRRKLSRSDLQSCSVVQLNVLRTSLYEDIQDLSSQLVKHLVVRDNLRTKQDAMLLDVQDMT